MEPDEVTRGRVLSRREIVVLLGAAGGALAARPAPAQSTRPAPACVVRPAQTEGPFYVDERLERSDIRTDPATSDRRPGAPLELAFTVSRLASGSCAPLAGAIVDVWHCDAAGAYSDVRDAGHGSTTGQRFLRGYQTTNAAGLARFTTIYPGWYQGRAVHIHFKVRTAQRQEFTSQIYFDEAAPPFKKRRERETMVEPAHDRAADRRIKSGAIAAAGQYSDIFSHDLSDGDLVGKINVLDRV